MEDFTLRELECFVAVSEELSFTRAAERIRLAQPPLSRHVRNLEEKLGVALFERSRRGVTLTGPGRVFGREARDILPQVRRAAEAAKRAAGGETDRLEVGFVSAVLSSEMVAVFSRFRRERPEVRLNLHDRPPSDQLEALEKGELDLGFVGVAPARMPERLVAPEWMGEDLRAYLPPDHRLAGEPSIRLADLADDPWVMIASEAAPSFVTLVRAFCREAGFRPRVVQESDRAQAVVAMTVAGSGAALLPASLDRIAGNGVPVRKVRNRRVRITHAIAHREEPSRVVRGFLDILRA